MGLPKEIMQSFQEQPGVDYSHMEGMTDMPVLESLQQNPALAKMLGGAKKMMENMDFPNPNSVVSSQMDPYNWQGKPTSMKSTNNVDDTGFYTGGDKELPSTEELFKRTVGNGRTDAGNNISHKVYQQQPQTVQNVGIDYGLINTMIKSAISEGLAGLKTQLLTEGKKNTPNEVEFMTIIKDTIKFVDKNGNLYEGKLKKTGTIN